MPGPVLFWDNQVHGLTQHFFCRPPKDLFRAPVPNMDDSGRVSIDDCDRALLDHIAVEPVVVRVLIGHRATLIEFQLEGSSEIPVGGSSTRAILGHRIRDTGYL
jgi:hypothetical protein